MLHATRLLQRPFGAPDQLAPVGQAGQRIEVGQLANLVFGRAAVGHVLHDAAVAHAMPVFVELGLGFCVDDALTAIEEHDGHVCRQHRGVSHGLVQLAQEGAAVVLRHHAQQRAQRDALVRSKAKDAQRLG